ncbi:MAG: hypothetical protein K2P79_06455 [Sphingomonas sp.]|nr:hypothetical protein [Sphingomonas sp.]
MTRFTHFATIDWSGAKGSSHAGIAVAICAEGDAAPVLVPPPGRTWSRLAVLDWLRMQADASMLLGFDFSFAPPLVARGAYLPGEVTPDTARAFWGYVDAACDDADLGAASFLESRRGTHFYLGAPDGTKRDFMHFRACETRYRSGGGGKPSTVYDAIGAAQVAKASFAGMRLLHHIGDAIPVWPVDPLRGSGAAIVEIYTSIAARAAGVGPGRTKMRGPSALDAALTHPAIGSRPHAPLDRYDDHATDAILTAAWLRAKVSETELWYPTSLTTKIALSEGWTFGVV